MKICNPAIDIPALLCDIPQEWRDSITKALILALQEEAITCADIRKCQSITELSAFTILGDILSVSFTDENGTVFTRTVNITDVINNALLDVDPKCLMSQEAWNALSLQDKIQAVIGQYCGCCAPTTTTSTTTTTTASPTTTTTTTLACGTYTIVYPDGLGEELEISYTDCDGNPQTITLGPGESVTFCALAGTIVYPNDLVLIFDDPGCTECCNINDITGHIDNEDLTTTTTTTTIAPTTTTTSSTSTTSTSSTTTTTTEAPLYYWGWKNSNTVLTEPQIVASPNFAGFTPGQDLTAFYAGGVATPQFLWMAEPSTEPLKHHWQDLIVPLNGGSIGTDQDLFDAPVISGSFRFYISVYVTQQADPIQFRVL